MRATKVIVSLLAALTLVVCVHAVAQTPPQVPPAQAQNPIPAPRTPDSPPGTHVGGFAGQWKSDWGAMQINVREGKAAGMYEHRHGRIEGEMSADGRTLTGVWREAPSYSVGQDGGSFVFTLSPDGDSFEGYIWSGQEKGGEAQDFIAVRMKEGSAPPRKPPLPGPQIGSFAGRWDSEWGTLLLEVEGQNVKGTFSQGNGRIEGTLSDAGRVLTGKWRKAPTYTPGADGGAFIFKLSHDGKIIEGSYWHWEQTKGAGTRWKATRAP